MPDKTDASAPFWAKGYYSLEDKYYDFLDWLESFGVKAYDYFAHPIERAGIPSFPVFCLIILLLIFGLLWLAFFQSGQATGAFVVRVQSSSGNDVNNATVSIYNGTNYTVAQGVTHNGVVSFGSLPATILTVRATASGFSPSVNLVDTTSTSHLDITLQCAGTCPTSNPTPTASPPSPTPPGKQIYFGPTPTYPQDGNSTVDVTIIDSTTNNLVDGATVTILDSVSGQVLGTGQAPAGTALIPVQTGSTVTVSVTAPGYLNYNSPTSYSVANAVENINVALIPNSAAVTTNFNVFDQNHNPLSALLEIYLSGSQQLYAQLNATNGIASLQMPAGAGATVEAYASNYSTSQVAFNAGETVNITLSPLPVNQPPGCVVSFPAYPAGQSPVQVQAGAPLATQVTLQNLTANSVVVECGSYYNTTANCQGNSCSATCVLNNTGSVVVGAYASGSDYGAIDCTLLQSVQVIPIQTPYCRLTLLPALIEPGQGTQVSVSYGELGPVAGGQIPVNCGNGQVAYATGCSDNSGSCTATCPAYSLPGTYAVTSSFDSVGCGATLTAYGSAQYDSCSVEANPSQVGLQQQATITVSYNISQPSSTGNATISCGNTPATATSCTGTTGSCSATCSFNSIGSNPVIATIGNASCETDAQVYALGFNSQECSVSPFPAAIPLPWQDNVSIPYNNFNPSPGVSDLQYSCDSIEPSNSTLTSPITQTQTLSQFNAVCTYQSADNGVRLVQPFANLSSTLCTQPNPLLTVFDPTSFQSHTVCNSENACVWAQGPGPNDCGSDSDCANQCGSGGCSYSPVCSTSQTCIQAVGGGQSCSSNSDCANNNGAYCQIQTLGGGSLSSNGYPSYYVGQQIPLQVDFVGFGLNTQGDLQYFNSAAQSLACGSMDGSGLGTSSVSSSCSITGGVAQCQANCLYQPGLNGTKNASTTLFLQPSNTYYPCSSTPFDVTALPGPICNINPSANPVGLGTPDNLLTTYSQVQDQFGNLDNLTPGQYTLSCGSAQTSPGQSVQIQPVAQPACTGSSGSCSATCIYSPSQVNLNLTSAVNAQFQTQPDSGLAPLQCVSPQISFNTIPASALVDVTYLGLPVPNAFATLYLATINSSGVYETGACQSNVTGPDGSAYFDHCTQLGQFAGNLYQDQAVIVGVSYTNNTLPPLTGNASAFLLLPTTTGPNPITVQVAPPNATATFTLLNALTGNPSADLNSAQVNTSCLEINPQAGQWTNTQYGVDSGIYASRQTYEINSVAECFVNVSASGYYPISGFLLPTASAGQDIPVTLSLTPSSSGITSQMQLEAVQDLQDNGAFLNLQNLQLEKSFSYNASFQLQIYNSSPKVGAFMQGSNSTTGQALIFNSSAPPFPLSAIGGTWGSGASCSYSQAAFKGSTYQWVDWESTNSPGVQQSPVNYNILFTMDPKATDTSDLLSYRSYTYNTTNNPAYSLSPYDPNATIAADSGRPWCTAQAYSTPYTLVDSSQTCDPASNYCVSVNYFQQGANSGLSGDGFTANSDLWCSSNNPTYCYNVTINVGVDNPDVPNGNLQTSYTLSLGTDANYYEIRGVSFDGLDGGAMLTNPGDGGGVLKSINASSIVLDIYSLYGQIGATQSITAHITATPLNPTLPPDNRTNVTAVFTSTTGSVERDSWARVQQSMGSLTQFAAFTPANQYLSQQEQVNPNDLNAGYGALVTEGLQNASIPFNQISPSSLLNSSVDDCMGKAVQGWQCTPMVLNQYASILLGTPDARFAAIIPQAFTFESFNYTVTDPNGNRVASRNITLQSLTSNDFISTDGKTLNFSIGPLQAGYNVAYTLAIDPVAPTPQSGDSVPAEVLYASFQNGPSTGTLSNGMPFGGGAATFPIWVESGYHYAYLTLNAVNGLTNSPITGVTYQLSYFQESNGTPVQLAQCTDSSSTPCTYRLEPTLWSQQPCPNPNSGDSGCIVGLENGYYPSNPVPIVATQNGGQGTLEAGSNANLAVALFPAAQGTSAITGLAILNPTGGTICQWPAASGVPDCTDQSSYTLSKGATYNLSLVESVAPGSVGAGAMLSIANSVQTGYFTSLPTAAQELGPNGAPDGNNMTISQEAWGNQFPASTCPAMQQPSGAAPGYPSWFMLNYSTGNAAPTNYLLPYQFTVASSGSGSSASSLNISYNSLAVVPAANGNLEFFRTPQWPQGYSNPLGWGADWCQAPTVNVTASLLDPDQSCNSQLCASMSYSQQGSYQPNGLTTGGPGFQAMSQTYWDAYNPSNSFPPLAINITLTQSQPLPAFGVTLSTNGANLLFDNVAAAEYCGSTANLPPDVNLDNSQGMGQSTFTFNFNSACQSTGAQSQTILTVYATPLAINTPQDPQTQIPLTVSTTSSSPIFTFNPPSWVDVVIPGSITVGSNSVISTNLAQVLLGGGSIQTDGTQPQAQFNATKGCTFGQIDNLYSQNGATGGDACPEGYIKESYGITSKVNNPNGMQLAFSIPASTDNGLTLLWADSTQPTVSVYKVEGGNNEVYVGSCSIANGNSAGSSISCQFDPSGDNLGAIVTIPGPINTNDEFLAVFTMYPSNTQNLLLPNGVKLSVVNGQVGSADTADSVFSVNVPGGTVSTGPITGFACGSIGIPLDAQGAGLQSCPQTGFQISPIFPADGIPLIATPAFIATCGDPLKSGLYSFSTAHDPTLPSGTIDITNWFNAQAHDYVDPYGNGTGDAILLNPDDPNVKYQAVGNQILLNGVAVTPGTIFGATNLTFTCGNHPNLQTSVELTVEESQPSFNALDASYIFYTGQAHELDYTLYNGQFPTTLNVKSLSDSASVSYSQPTDFSSNRVNYYLTNYGNSYDPTQRDITNFPIDVSTTAQLISNGGAAPQSTHLTLQQPALPDTQTTYPNNLLNTLVSDVHSDPLTSDLFSDFLSVGGNGYGFSNGQQSQGLSEKTIAYVSSVYRNVPSAFMSTAQQAAGSTGFWRSPYLGADYYCGYEFVPPSLPTSCTILPNNIPQVNITLSDGSMLTWNATAQYPNPITGNPAIGGWQYGNGTIDPFQKVSGEVPSGTQACYGDASSWYQNGLVDCNTQASCLSPNSVEGDSTDSNGNPTYGYEDYSDAQSELAGFSTSVATTYQGQPFSYSDYIAQAYTDPTTGQNLPQIDFGPDLPLTLGGNIAFNLTTNVVLPGNFSKGVKYSGIQAFLEYKNSTSPNCGMVTEDGWCTTGSFLGVSLSAPLQQAQDSSGNTYWYIPVNANGLTDSANAVRVRLEDSSGNTLGHSMPIRIMLDTSLSASCLGQGRLNDPNDPQLCSSQRFASDCVNGRQNLLDAVVPVKVALFNQTPVTTALSQQLISQMQAYRGIPFKYFSQDVPGGNFTFASPLLYWGWDPTGLSGFGTSVQQTCSAGLGFYELDASTKDGVSYQYSYSLKTLPLSNYLLTPENSDNGQVTYGGSGGNTIGCTEATEYNSGGPWSNSSATDWTTYVYSQGSSNLVPVEAYNDLPDSSETQSEVSQSQATDGSDKYLCNVFNLANDQHDHLCQGECDCVQHCYGAFCGNCGDPVPECMTTTSQTSLYNSIFGSSSASCASQGDAGYPAITESCLENAFETISNNQANSDQAAAGIAAYYIIAALRADVLPNSANQASCKATPYTTQNPAYNSQCVLTEWNNYFQSSRMKYCQYSSLLPSQPGYYRGVNPDTCYNQDTVIAD